MPSADRPTQLEKDLSNVTSSFPPPLGIILAVAYYLKYPRGFRTLARNCVLVSVATMVAYTVALVFQDILFQQDKRTEK